MNPARKNNTHCHQIEAKSVKTEGEKDSGDDRERTGEGLRLRFKKPVDLF